LGTDSGKETPARRSRRRPKRRLATAKLRRRMTALLLVAPLLLFLGVMFLYPIALLLWRSVHDPLIADTMPRTIEALRDWDGRSLPGESAFAALVADLAAARADKMATKIGSRLNIEVAGLRRSVDRVARQAETLGHGPYRNAVVALDERWGEPESWRAVQRLGWRVTPLNYLAAADLQLDAEGRIVPKPADRRIYLALFGRTLWMSALVTAACLAIAYPLAYFLANLPERLSNILRIVVLVPLWTSLLVRTAAWIVLLQTQGVLNDLLVWSGVTSDAGRIKLIFNAFGTVVAMIHILLPFMVLTLYSVMKAIPDNYMRAAQSLGAGRIVAFWRVYVPSTRPGINAGCLLVFILATGYYITPALVGGDSGQMISNMIAYHMRETLNWGLAAALATMLLAAIVILFQVYSRFVGLDRFRLG